MQDKWLAGMIDELMTAWQENRGEVEIREAFAEILERSLQEKEYRMREAFTEISSKLTEGHILVSELLDNWGRYPSEVTGLMLRVEAWQKEHKAS